MKKQKEKLDVKLAGKVYTEKYVVDIILDLVGYTGGNIRKRHIIDNSCGDGAFLIEVVNRYCKQCVKENVSPLEIANELREFIHGIEINPEECNKCKNNLINVACNYNIRNIDFDICCEDALKSEHYNGKMDYVVGNPPYVRVHNLRNSSESVKKMQFTKNGMTDLYIAFFEIGINMLNDSGRLAYITPNSYFNSIAGSQMRKVFIKEHYLEKILDFKHFQLFQGASTYTTITVLKKDKRSGYVDYFEFDDKLRRQKLVDSLSSDEFYISGNFYFSTRKNLNLLRQILLNFGTCNIQVKNGYATLCDNVFIGDFDFESSYIIPIIKSSRGIVKKIIYPYNENSELIDENTLNKDEKLYLYLCRNKEVLENRDIDLSSGTPWYAFGRTQGINDTFKNKFTVNTLIRDKRDLKIFHAPPGVGVYSGLYIMGDGLNIDKIKDLLISQDFETYVSLLGKYKSGGYYTFSTKDIKVFLNYKLAYDKGLDI